MEQQPLHPDLLDLLSLLNAHKAEYLVVSAFAVGLYSEPRATKDLDVWVRSSQTNALKLFAALAEFGAP